MSLTYYNELTGWKYTPEDTNIENNYPETRKIKQYTTQNVSNPSWRPPQTTAAGYDPGSGGSPFISVQVPVEVTVPWPEMIKANQDANAEIKLKTAKNVFYSKIYLDKETPGIVNSTKGNV